MEKSNYRSVNSVDNDSGIIKSFSNTRLCTPVRKWLLLELDICCDALTIYHYTLINPDFMSDFNGYRLKKKLIKKKVNTEKIVNKNEMLWKLQRDSMYVRQFFEDIRDEMRERGTYTSLIKLIEETEKKEMEENNVIMDYIQAEKIVDDLKKNIDEEIRNNETEMMSLIVEFNNLKEKREKMELKIEREIGYTSAWKEAQCDEKIQRCNIRLKHLGGSLEYWLILKKNECRVAREIESFLKQNISFNVKASENWEERFNREMLMYKEKNNQLREDIESRRWILEQLEGKFRERQEFIGQYLAEKEAYRVQKELKEHEEYSATMIQAWWRGVMVRRKLGPYRPDEKKKKKTVKGKKMKIDRSISAII